MYSICFKYVLLVEFNTKIYEMLYFIILIVQLYNNSGFFTDYNAV